MSLDSRRNDIFGYVTTQWAAGAFASTPIEFANQDVVDRNKQVDPFVTCEIDYRDSHQASMDPLLLTRYYGELVFEFHVKEGQGTKPVNDMADVVKNFMKYKLLNGIVFRAPRPFKAVPTDGWHVLPLRVSFYFDE